MKNLDATLLFEYKIHASDNTNPAFIFKDQRLFRLQQSLNLEE